MTDVRAADIGSVTSKDGTTIEGGQQTLSNLAAYVTEIVRKGVEG